MKSEDFLHYLKEIPEQQAIAVLDKMDLEANNLVEEIKGSRIPKSIKIDSIVRDSIDKINEIFMDLYTYGFCDTQEDRECFFGARDKIVSLFKEEITEIISNL